MVSRNSTTPLSPTPCACKNDAALDIYNSFYCISVTFESSQNINPFTVRCRQSLKMARRTLVLVMAAALLLIAACEATMSIPALDSMTSMDSPFSAFASGTRIRNRKLVESQKDTQVFEEMTANRKPLRIASAPHWRSLAFAHSDSATSSSTATAFVDSSKPEGKFVAERVLNTISVAGGVLVMGFSMILP